VEAAAVELSSVLTARKLLISRTAATAKKAPLPDPLYVYCTKMIPLWSPADYRVTSVSHKFAGLDREKQTSFLRYRKPWTCISSMRYRYEWPSLFSMFAPVGKARESENYWNIRPRARRRKILQFTHLKSLPPWALFTLK
jgi:hypothetical protein